MKFGYGWFAAWRSHRHFRSLLNGYQTTALLNLAARLGIADLLERGPMSSIDLACSLGAHDSSLHRLLRAFVVIGICQEESGDRFGLAGAGKYLLKKPSTLYGQAIINGEIYSRAWNGLFHSAMTGEPAFNKIFGMDVWEYRRQHPELAEYFNAGLSDGASRIAREILKAYDLSPFHTIADIGGGYGLLLATILKAYPHARGILLDQPHVATEARPRLAAAGVAERCRIIGGDFFDSIPQGADVHILKSVIHDYDDQRSESILRNCKHALNRGGRLLLVEREKPERAESAPYTVLLDVNMLAVTGGRERRHAEYRAILEAAGFTAVRSISLRSGFNIFESM